MTYQQKISELKNIIHEKLTPLITDDYVLLGLPYHPNIGDSLIWEGSDTFLKTTPYKCLYTASVWSYNPNYRIPQNAIIIINGGGSFGDLWRHNTEFWLSLIQQYPHNKIIILPQSIHYKSKKLLKKDAKIFSEHKNLIICLRDNNSLKIANENFVQSTNILVPDMAFYIDITKWNKYSKTVSNKVLFLSRNDSEKKINQSYNIVPSYAEIHDWPTMENSSFSLKLFYKIEYYIKRLDGKLSTRFCDFLSDIVYKNVFRRSFMKEGIKFLSSYSDIYVTRLHAAILLILLQRPFVWFDNSYGKSSAFYDTWLSDIKNIKFIRE
ncbi:MAG: polysaccharide pyruvyl transferase family protein [Dysgonomonas sp.]